MYVYTYLNVICVLSTACLCKIIIKKHMLILFYDSLLLLLMFFLMLLECFHSIEFLSVCMSRSPQHAVKKCHQFLGFLTTLARALSNFQILPQELVITRNRLHVSYSFLYHHEAVKKLIGNLSSEFKCLDLMKLRCLMEAEKLELLPS